MTVLSDPGRFYIITILHSKSANLLLPLYCYGIINQKIPIRIQEQPHTFHIIKIARTSVPVVEW